MKSDIIRKRSRHDARRASINGGPEDSPPTSPVREVSFILAPDSTTQLSYDFEDSDSFRAISAPSASQLMSALGTIANTGGGSVNHIGGGSDTTHGGGGLYPTPSSPMR